MNLHVSYAQAVRRMSVETRLGLGVLLLDGLDVDEMVNGLFTMRVTMKWQRDDFAAAASRPSTSARTSRSRRASVS